MLMLLMLMMMMMMIPRVDLQEAGPGGPSERHDRGVRRLVPVSQLCSKAWTRPAERGCRQRGTRVLTLQSSLLLRRQVPHLISAQVVVAVCCITGIHVPL